MANEYVFNPLSGQFDIVANATIVNKFTEDGDRLYYDTALVQKGDILINERTTDPPTQYITNGTFEDWRYETLRVWELGFDDGTGWSSTDARTGTYSVNLVYENDESGNDSPGSIVGQTVYDLTQGDSYKSSIYVKNEGTLGIVYFDTSLRGMKPYAIVSDLGGGDISMTTTIPSGEVARYDTRQDGTYSVAGTHNGENYYLKSMSGDTVYIYYDSTYSFWCLGEDLDGEIEGFSDSLFGTWTVEIYPYLQHASCFEISAGSYEVYLPSGVEEYDDSDIYDIYNLEGVYDGQNYYKNGNNYYLYYSSFGNFWCIDTNLGTDWPDLIAPAIVGSWYGEVDGPDGMANIWNYTLQTWESMSVIDSSGTNLLDYFELFSTTEDWAQYTNQTGVIVNSSGIIAPIFFALTINPGDSTNLLFDDASCFKVGTSTNLLLDPSFEDWVIDDDLIPYKWWVDTFNNGEISQEDTNVHSGNYAILFESWSFDGAGEVIQKIENLDAANQYYITYYGARSSDNVNCSLYLKIISRIPDDSWCQVWNFNTESWVSADPYDTSDPDLYQSQTLSTSYEQASTEVFSPLGDSADGYVYVLFLTGNDGNYSKVYLDSVECYEYGSGAIPQYLFTFQTDYQQQEFSGTETIFRFITEGSAYATALSFGANGMFDSDIPTLGVTTNWVVDEDLYLGGDVVEYLSGGGGDSISANILINHPVYLNNPHHTGISNLEDVNIAAIANGQILQYELSSTSWKNVTIPTPTEYWQPTPSGSDNIYYSDGDVILYPTSEATAVSTEVNSNNLSIMGSAWDTNDSVARNVGVDFWITAVSSDSPFPVLIKEFSSGYSIYEYINNNGFVFGEINVIESSNFCAYTFTTDLDLSTSGAKLVSFGDNMSMGTYDEKMYVDLNGGLHSNSLTAIGESDVTIVAGTGTGSGGKDLILESGLGAIGDENSGNIILRSNFYSGTASHGNIDFIYGTNSLFIRLNGATQEAEIAIPAIFEDRVEIADEIRFYDDTMYVGFKAPSLVSGTTLIWELPDSDGTNGQTLVTNGSGALSWSTISSGAWTVLSGDDIYYEDGNIIFGNDLIINETDTATAVNTTYNSEVITLKSSAWNTGTSLADEHEISIYNNAIAAGPATFSLLGIEFPDNNSGMSALNPTMKFGAFTDGLYSILSVYNGAVSNGYRLLVEQDVDQAGSKLLVIGDNESGGTFDTKFSVDYEGTIEFENGAQIGNKQNTDIDTGTETVDTFAATEGDACVWHYVVKNGTNLRAGTVTACWSDTSGSPVEYTETNTNDIGDTSNLTLAVDLDSNNVRLRATAASDNWEVRVIRNLI